MRSKRRWAPGLHSAEWVVRYRTDNGFGITYNYMAETAGVGDRAP